MKITKIASKPTPSLSPVHQANTADKMVILLMPLISKKNNLSKTVTKKLKIQLRLYFQATGIATNYASAWWLKILAGQL